MSEMSNAQVNRFAASLDEIIDRERDVNKDDRLTIAEIVGCLEVAKARIINESLDRSEAC